MSDNGNIFSDDMARPKTHNSTADRIWNQVKRAADGTVFHSGQFLDLDSRASVDQALSRMAKAETLRRLARGLYYRPRRHPVLGEITPSVDAIAKALAERDRIKLQPSGAYAANLLRLSEQVPMRIVFLTDGKPRKISIGKRIIELRRASPRMMAAAGRMTGLLIAGLRFVGKANVPPGRVAHLRNLLSPADRRRLIDDLPLAPVWMHPHFRSIAAEESAK